MKKILLFICLSVSCLTFSGFGFIDNPKAVHAKNGRMVKIKSQSAIQKVVVDQVVIDELQDLEAKELDETKISIISKIFQAFKFVVISVYTLIFK